jgi:glucokinase
MVVSTGVGGGIVLNGQLLDGESGNAGHIGHVIVEPNGRRCPCGGRGCLEAEASGPAIEAITGRPPTQPTYEIMVRTGRLVGRGVASVCNLLDLKLVCVGGSVALGFGATFFNSAQRTLDELCGLEFSKNARIVPSRLADEGGLIGASAIGWRGLNRMASVSY